MIKPSIIKFNQLGSTEIGYISIAEVKRKIPFEVKRVYWTYYTPNHVIRGGHSHKKLYQLIVAVNGVIEFSFEDIKGNKYKYSLDKPSLGLLIPPGYWRTIRFSHNAVMLCIASDYYDETDYIRNYSEFKNS